MNKLIPQKSLNVVAGPTGVFLSSITVTMSILYRIKSNMSEPNQRKRFDVVILPNSHESSVPTYSQEMGNNGKWLTSKQLELHQPSKVPEIHSDLCWLFNSKLVRYKAAIFALRFSVLRLKLAMQLTLWLFNLKKHCEF